LRDDERARLRIDIGLASPPSHEALGKHAIALSCRSEARG